MAEYAIGDVQGCYEPLMRLLAAIDFNDRVDKLWFVGDLVNRGPDSLAVLTFIQSLHRAPRIVLGNHDLHLLAAIYTKKKPQSPSDTIQKILQAKNREELGAWLRAQALLYHNEEYQTVMTHAGIYPLWDLPTAKAMAQELETTLQGNKGSLF